MDKIPLFKGKSYEKLKVIEFRNLKNKSAKKDKKDKTDYPINV